MLALLLSAIPRTSGLALNELRMILLALAILLFGLFAYSELVAAPAPVCSYEEWIQTSPRQPSESVLLSHPLRLPSSAEMARCRR